MPEDPITLSDVFDLPHPQANLREPDGHARWFVTEFFTSGQGHEMASLRSVDGRHFVTVAVKASRYTTKNGDGEDVVFENPSLAHATNIERGGRAAAQQKFDEHHALWNARHEAREKARLAEARGDSAAALKHAGDAREVDAAMKRHCRNNGLRLQHV